MDGRLHIPVQLMISSEILVQTVAICITIAIAASAGVFGFWKFSLKFAREKQHHDQRDRDKINRWMSQTRTDLATIVANTGHMKGDIDTIKVQSEKQWDAIEKTRQCINDVKVRIAAMGGPNNA